MSFIIMKRWIVILFLFFFLPSLNFPAIGVSAGDKKPVKIVVVEQPPVGNNKEGRPYDDVDKNGVTTMDATAKNYTDKQNALGIQPVIRASSVKDMVKKILESLKEDECISSLTICGHGSPGDISMGDGLNSETGNHINDNMEEWEEELGKLKDKFCPGASVTLKGCNVGACDKGAEKLQEIADTLGVPVEAPTGTAHSDCTYENGSEMQRAEPSPPDSFEHNDPPKCKQSPADKAKAESNATYNGPAPFNQNQVIGIEVLPPGLPVLPPDPTGDASFDAKPGDVPFDLFMHGINYGNSLTIEKRLLANHNAMIAIHFEDGTVQHGMFQTDFDHFIFPFPKIDKEGSGITKTYATLSIDLELWMEEVCKKKLDAAKANDSLTLTVTAKCGYMELRWNVIPNALTYYIYRGPGEGKEYPMPLTDFPIKETSYQDTKGLVLNQKYCYFVQAVNKEDQEFKKSNEACAVYICQEEVPPIGEQDCKLLLRYQVDNMFYWKNGIQRGPMDATPVIRENRVNLMARYVAEETGATVGWNQTTKTVLITRADGKVISMQIGNPIAIVDGTPYPIDPNNPLVAPFILNNRTYTGLRFIAYNLGATGPNEIVWKAETRIVELIFKDPNCRWLCGCIRNKIHTPAGDLIDYKFFENCNKVDPYSINLPMSLKDQLHHLAFQEYTKEYPNQEYWCAEIRIDEHGFIIAWRARPDLYPHCCK